MNGPQHYAEAERLMAEADTWMSADHGSKAFLPTEERIARRTADIAAAQVHATLAIAAATAIQPATYGSNRPESQAWRDVAGVKP